MNSLEQIFGVARSWIAAALVAVFVCGVPSSSVAAPPLDATQACLTAIDQRPGAEAVAACERAIHVALQTALMVRSESPTRWINPGWYLLWAYHGLFTLMSLGPRHEQVLVADLLAAKVEGSERLADALVTGLDAEVRYRAKLDAIEAEMLARGGPLHDVYRHTGGARANEQALGEALGRAMDETTAWPALPSVGQRIAWIEGLALPGSGAPAPATGPAAQLLADRDQLLAAGTNAIRIRLERKLNKFIKLAEELPG